MTYWQHFMLTIVFSIEVGRLFGTALGFVY